jgi:NCS1 family nucleobase:cation symporter-1
VGVLPCLPGYLAVAGIVSKEAMPTFLIDLFSFGWFFSLFVSGVVYYLSASRQPKLKGVTA